jgi:hypothetical protein
MVQGIVIYYFILRILFCYIMNGQNESASNLSRVTALVLLLCSLATVVGTQSSTLLVPAFAEDVDDFDDIEELSEAIDDNEVDDDDVEDFKDSEAYEGADDEIQECIDDAEELGDNLGDYEIQECVEGY